MDLPGVRADWHPDTAIKHWTQSDIISKSYILEVFLQGVVQVFPRPWLAQAGVGVDHLPEEDPGFHQSLGQGPRMWHVHVPVLGAVSNQKRVVTEILHVSGSWKVNAKWQICLILATVFRIHIHRVSANFGGRISDQLFTIRKNSKDEIILNFLEPRQRN